MYTQGGSLSDTSSLQAIEPIRSLCVLRRRISRMMAICINPCFVVWPRPRKSRPVHFLSQGQRAAALGPWWLVCSVGAKVMYALRGAVVVTFSSSSQVVLVSHMSPFRRTATAYRLSVEHSQTTILQRSEVDGIQAHTSGDGLVVDG